MKLDKYPILVRGAGEHASGVAWHLHRAGFPLVMTERHEPLAVRRHVAFARAARKGESMVEGVIARLCGERLHPDEHGEPADAPTPVVDDAIAEAVREVWKKGEIAVVIDDGIRLTEYFDFAAIVDARMLKEADGPILGKAPFTLALGPGYTAGEHVDAVVETLRGHDLGRVYYKGSAAPNTGVPGEVGGETHTRVYHSPCEGRFWAHVKIGQMVRKGDLIGVFEGDCKEPCTIVAEIPGIVRGLLADGEIVPEGTKVADVDPRGEVIDPATLSEKTRALAGGVLTALLAAISEGS
ncbi:molybdenum hydroxylase [bacterium]|nr:molybdenum hydroxylase [bacterium]